MTPLAITLGDPAGIGGEIVLKALEQIDPRPVALFGSWELAHRGPGAALLDRFTKVSRAPDDSGDWSNLWTFVDVGSSDGFQFGRIDAGCGRVALASIEAAADATERGLCSALVTAPIQKEALAAAGSRLPGHTEILAQRSGLQEYGREYAMYFDSPSLRVVLLSVHLSLRGALALIQRDRIAAVAELTDREYRKLYGAAPKVAVAAVNPHGGDGGLFGDEENEIAAGVAEARARGVDATGPHPADTVFHSAAGGRFDVVLAMYHDQGLIAVKTLAFDRSVNVTIGLPYLRCSVDHGTAFDIAGKGKADAGPMRYAIEWAAAHVR